MVSPRQFFIFDLEFHPSSYGYRPGRSCQQAVVKEDKENAPKWGWRLSHVMPKGFIPFCRKHVSMEVEYCPFFEGCRHLNIRESADYVIGLGLSFFVLAIGFCEWLHSGVFVAKAYRYESANTKHKKLNNPDDRYAIDIGSGLLFMYS